MYKGQNVLNMLQDDATRTSTQSEYMVSSGHGIEKEKNTKVMPNVPNGRDHPRCQNPPKHPSSSNDGGISPEYIMGCLLVRMSASRCLSSTAASWSMLATCDAYDTTGCDGGGGGSADWIWGWAPSILASSGVVRTSESSESESESEDEDSASSMARRCSMISLGAFCESKA